MATRLFPLAILAAHAAGYDADPMHVPADSPIRQRLLLPGVYHGSEVQAKAGDRLLALLRDKNGYRTAMATIKIDMVLDAILDIEEDSRPTAKRISVNGSPVFLLKGYDRVAGRSVNTAFDGEVSLHPHATSHVYFAGKKIELVVQPNGKVDKLPGDENIELFQVTIRQGDSEQVLPLVVNAGYKSVELLWAGDFDGDGKVDLLFRDSGYNWASDRLFLSSAAKPGDLLAEVAQFYTTGC